MKVLVHLNAPDLAPVGAWVLRDGVPHPVYLDTATPLEATAAVQMASKVEGVSWEDYWTNQLVTQHPYFDTYELVDMDDRVTDKEVKGALRHLT